MGEENTKKKLKMTSSSNFTDIVQLNVGGVHYETTISTLTNYPSTMLAAMFESPALESLPPAKRDKSGRHFIDRDGEVFKYVLDYLRTGLLLLPKNCNEYEYNKLCAEADYYQIQPLIDSLANHICNKPADVVLLRIEGREVIQLCGPYKILLDLKNNYPFGAESDDPPGLESLDNPVHLDDGYGTWQTNVFDLRTVDNYHYMQPSLIVDELQRLGYICFSDVSQDRCSKFIKYGAQVAHNFSKLE